MDFPASTVDKNLSASNRDADTENKLQDTGGGGVGEGEGKGEGNGESSLEAYTLPYVTQTANGNLLYGSGNSNQGSVTTHRGGEGWEVGGRFKTEGYMCMCVYTHIYIHTHSLCPE